MDCNLEEMPDLVRLLLEGRGIVGEDIGLFLNPALEALAPPEELPGVVEAADVILKAVAEHRKIVVFGDYDCDGVCATAIATKTIRALLTQREIDEEQVVPFIPDRLNEGYGMSEPSVARMLKETPDASLVVTVDNGINSIEQVAELKARGVEVVITDHHLPSETLPCADAIVNPKVKSTSRLQWLCGAGVAYLLASRVITEARKRGMYTGKNIGGQLLVLAGLATVTDIMPLTGQNRIIVAEALRHFHAWAPIGLKELLSRVSRTTVVQMTTRDFGFTLGPRINAAGRVATSMESLELILSTDQDIARELARMVDCYNTDRKSIEQKMTDDAWSKVVLDASAQVIDLPDGHAGVAGIVAARVLERIASATGRKVPVCVIAGGHGSARAPEGLNIRDAMESCKEYLDRYGGHAAAGGFSVKPGCTDGFRKALCEYSSKFMMRTISADEGICGLLPDVWVGTENLTLELAEWIAKLEPFGDGNPEPLLGLRGMRFSDIKQLGHDGRHLAISFVDRACPRAVWWNHGGMIEDLRKKSSVPFDLVFTLGISEYGERHAEVRIAALRETEVGK